MQSNLLFNAMNHMLGMRVIEDANLPRFKTVQFRFPKTKKKRIQNKWKKNNKNFKEIPFNSAYILNGNILIIHPADLLGLKQN